MKKRIKYFILFTILIGIISAKNVNAASFDYKCKSLKIYEKYDLKQIITGYDESTSFSSSDTSVAVVSNDGIVTTKKLGKAEITMQDSSGTNTITISSGYLNGIDISTFNNTVNWEMVKKHGIDFVMIRAGYGWYDQTDIDNGLPFNCQVDDQLLNNMKGAIDYDIPFGVYHYSYADTLEKADKEADYIIQILDEYAAEYKDKMTLPVAYDVEEGKLKNVGKVQLTNIAIKFCTRIYDAGYVPIIYANRDFFSNYLDLDKLNALAYNIWYTNWKSDVNYSSKITIADTNLVPFMWQYTDKGSVPGANTSDGVVDLDLMYMKDRVKIDVYNEENTLIDTIGADKGGKLDYIPTYEKQGYIVSFLDSNNTQIDENTTFNTNTNINVKLERINVESIEINTHEIELDTLTPSEEYILSVTSHLPETSVIEDGEIGYMSSNEKVARVDENGKLLFIGKGECVITVYLKANENVKAECNVRVNPKIQKGDITEDGFINASDAAVVLDKYKNDDVEEKDLRLGDMNDDNFLNSSDAAMILDIFKNN